MRQAAWNIEGGADGGVQAESFVWRQVLKPFSPRRVAGRMGACVKVHLIMQNVVNFSL